MKNRKIFSFFSSPYQINMKLFPIKSITYSKFQHLSFFLIPFLILIFNCFSRFSLLLLLCSIYRRSIPRSIPLSSSRSHSRSNSIPSSRSISRSYPMPRSRSRSGSILTSSSRSISRSNLIRSLRSASRSHLKALSKSSSRSASISFNIHTVIGFEISFKT